jgi:hypothetical protein
MLILTTATSGPLGVLTGRGGGPSTARASHTRSSRSGLKSNGAYSDTDMRLWKQKLEDVPLKYPNMRIYDRASVAQPGWFQPDGVDYTPAGYARRAHLIADAAAAAFPAAAFPVGGVRHGFES